MGNPWGKGDFLNPITVAQDFRPVGNTFTHLRSPPTMSAPMTDRNPADGCFSPVGPTQFDPPPERAGSVTGGTGHDDWLRPARAGPRLPAPGTLSDYRR